MTNKIVTDQSQQVQESPFDSIRRVDADGEYWLARELMPLLGYEKWERFADAVDRAKAACENAGNSIRQHFFPEVGKSNGRPKVDFRLTRYACYLAALNGDPRKPEVAQAQSYFAVKTREAEVFIPAQNDRLRELELEVRMLKMQTEIHELKEAINKRPIADTHPSQPPQVIDSPSDLSEAMRRRNLAEMEAACTPGTEEHKSAIAVRQWLNRN